MKSRIRKVANFFAFNLLFFALYLNFIYQDNAATPPPSVASPSIAAVKSTVAVENPAPYLAGTAAATEKK